MFRHLFRWLIVGWATFVMAALILVFSRSTSENFLSPKEYTLGVGAGVLLILFGFRMMFEKTWRPIPEGILRPLAMLCIWCGLSMAWSPVPECALLDFSQVCQALLCCLIIGAVAGEENPFRPILMGAVIVALLATAMNFLEVRKWYFEVSIDPPRISYASNELVRLSVPELKDRLASGAVFVPFFPESISRPYKSGATLGNPNYLATLQAMLVFATLGLGLQSSSWFWNCAGLILFVGVVLTSCRAAFLGIVVGIAFLTWMAWRAGKLGSARKWGKPLLAVVAVGVCFGVWQSPRNVFARFRGLLSENFERNHRILAWKVATTEWKDPLSLCFGRGFGSFRFIFPFSKARSLSDQEKERWPRGTVRQLHNDWLQFGVETGLIGLFLVSLTGWKTFSSVQNSLYKSAENDNASTNLIGAALFAGLTAVLVESAFDFPFHRPAESVLFIMIVGAVWQEVRGNSEPKTILGTGMALLLALVALTGGALQIWATTRMVEADFLTRQAEFVFEQKDPKLLPLAEKFLVRANSLFPIPGKACLHLAFVRELQKRPREVDPLADSAWRTIEYSNGELGYSSVLFRKMHSAYFREKDWNKVISLASDGLWLTTGSDRSSFHYHRVNAYIEMGRWEEAKTAFLPSAVRQDEFTVRACLRLAARFAGQARWNDVVDVCTPMVNKGTKDIRLLDLYGLGLAETGDLSGADKWLRQGLSIASESSLVLKDLGYVTAKAGNASEAVGFLEKALSSEDLDPLDRSKVERLLAMLRISR